MNPAINEILTQYDSLSSIISKIPKNTKNFDEFQKLWESFGETLHLFLLGYIDEINELNNKLKLQKIDEEKRVKQLETKLAEFEKAIPKVDFEYSEKVCRKEYGKSWSLLERNTKVFLTTAYYINRLIKSIGADYSVIVIECSKALEGELESKLYMPYRQYRTTPLLVEGGRFGQQMNQLLAGNIKVLSFAVMFAALKPTTRKINDYYNDFQKFLRAEKWDCSVLQDASFYETGSDYVSKYRNSAAHDGVLSAEVANECKIETKKLITKFIYAYSKN